jgi:hypothetical protein
MLFNDCKTPQPNAELCLLRLSDVVTDGNLLSPRMHLELEKIAFAVGVPLSSVTPLSSSEMRRHSASSQQLVDAAGRADSTSMLERLGVDADDQGAVRRRRCVHASSALARRRVRRRRRCRRQAKDRQQSLLRWRKCWPVAQTTASGAM